LSNDIENWNQSEKYVSKIILWKKFFCTILLLYINSFSIKSMLNNLKSKEKFTMGRKFQNWYFSWILLLILEKPIQSISLNGQLIILKQFEFFNKKNYEKSVQFINWAKKIWCASRARVNLPHIGNRKCIKFVLHRNLLKMQCSTFLSRNLNGSYLYQNFEF
jgi:hypothetical protein